MDTDLPLCTEARPRCQRRSGTSFSMGRGSVSWFQGPVSWLLLIITNITISGLLGMHALQEIHWLQQRVDELKRSPTNNNPNMMGIRGMNVTEYYNFIASVNMLRGQENDLTNSKNTRRKEGDDDHNEYEDDYEYEDDDYDEYDDPEEEENTNRDTALAGLSRVKRSTSSPNNRKKEKKQIHKKLRFKVKKLRRDMKRTDQTLETVKKRLDRLNDSASYISRVRSSHFVAKPSRSNQPGMKYRRSESSGSYAFWHQEASTDTDTFTFDGTYGQVTVNVPGTYLIYAQVSYDPSVEQPGYTIVLETGDPYSRHLLDSCTTIPNHTPGPGKYIMCSTVTVARLGKGDVLSIAHSQYISQVIVTETEKTFWGVVRLGV